MFCKIIVTILSCLLVVQATKIAVKNIRSHSLRISITGQDDAVLKVGRSVVVNVPNNWSGTISAVREPCTDDGCKIRTQAHISLGTTEDAYQVSLIDGFNLPIKVTPIKGKRCKPALCSANITKKCPTNDQVKNEIGAVVACRNSPTLFGTVCPLAVVSEDDEDKIQRCKPASYLVLVG